MKLSVSVFATLMTLSLGVARADLLSGCGTCQGATYLLEYNPTPVGTYMSGLGKIFDLFLTINTTGLTIPTATNIKAVAVKISDTVDVPPSTVQAAPGGASLWTLAFGGINSSGCDGAGNGFMCAQDPPPNAATLPHTGTYAWEFHYATTGALMLNPLESTIKVDYSDAAGSKVGAIVSEGITLQEKGGGPPPPPPPPPPPVPEPGSVVLLSTVLGSAGWALRKRHLS